MILNTEKNAWAKGDNFKAGKKYLQVSTDEVYLSLGNEEYFTEIDPFDFQSPYSSSKAYADLMVKAILIHIKYLLK